MSNQIRGLLPLSVNNPLRAKFEEAVDKAVLYMLHTDALPESAIDKIFGTEETVTEDSETVFNLEVATEQARFLNALISTLGARPGQVCTMTLGGVSDAPEGVRHAQIGVVFHDPDVVPDYSTILVTDPEPTNGD